VGHKKAATTLGYIKVDKEKALNQIKLISLGKRLARGSESTIKKKEEVKEEMSRQEDDEENHRGIIQAARAQKTAGKAEKIKKQPNKLSED
jgi:hypothetical protein